MATGWPGDLQVTSSTCRCGTSTRRRLPHSLPRDHFPLRPIGSSIRAHPDEVRLLGVCWRGQLGWLGATAATGEMAITLCA
jgi:hypothetical protein